MKRITAIILCASLAILIICLSLILVKTKDTGSANQKEEKLSGEIGRESEAKEGKKESDVSGKKDEKESKEDKEAGDTESVKNRKPGGTESKADKKTDDAKSAENKKADDAKSAEGKDVSGKESSENNTDVKKDEENRKISDEKRDSEDTPAAAGDYSKYDNTKYSWWIVRTKDHTQPRGEDHVKLSDYDAYFVNPDVSDDDKVMYLAFDCGYEYGYTEKILDVLKEHNVKGMFFLTKTFLDSDPELARRMVEEGHMCGNHTITHPSLPTKSDEGVKKEILDLENYFEEVTGHKLDKFIRPPMGEFSERTLKITQDLGYKSIFWSTVYLDYDVNKQPGKEYVVQYYRDNHHNGAITLTHTVSESNTQALGQVIEEMEALGYRFGTLNELN